MAIGVSLGVAAALRQNRPVDYVATAVAVLGVCIPTFVTAPMLVLLFAAKLGWLPTGGWGGVRNLILPIVVLALPQVAIISRLTRAGMIEVLRSNYVRTARAKGLSERDIVLRHALRGAVLPLVSYLGPAAAGLITGSLVVEQIFALPGLGKSFVIGALQRDYTVVMGVVILYAALILLLNLVADVVYGLLDPRVRIR
jgi:oligopeptide transport system permease protein